MSSERVCRETRFAQLVDSRLELYNLCIGDRENMFTIRKGMISNNFCYFKKIYKNITNIIIL